MEERLSIPYTVDEKTGSQVAAVRLKASVWPAGIVYGTVLNQANWLITNLNGGIFKEKTDHQRADIGADVHAPIRPIQGRDRRHLGK